MIGYRARRSPQIRDPAGKLEWRLKKLFFRDLNVGLSNKGTSTVLFIDNKMHGEIWVKMNPGFRLEVSSTIRR